MLEQDPNNSVARNGVAMEYKNAGELAEATEHSLNRVTVFLTDQDFRVTGSDGTVASVQHHSGDAVWGTSVTHSEENASDKPFEAVAVEVKN